MPRDERPPAHIRRRATEVNAEHEIETRWTRQFCAFICVGLFVALLVGKACGG